MQLTLPEIRAKEMHKCLNKLNNGDNRALLRALVRMYAFKFNLKLVKENDVYKLEEND